MNTNWIPCPCKGCQDRNAHCHSSCEGYKEYKDRCNAERDQLIKEKQLDRHMYDIQQAGFGKRPMEIPDPLRHGRKKR